jgi:hypothetical protein
LPVGGKLSDWTCSGVMQKLVVRVIGPMPDIDMVVVADHMPALPCAPKAAAGTSEAAQMKAESVLCKAHPQVNLCALCVNRDNRKVKNYAARARIACR